MKQPSDPPLYPFRHDQLRYAVESPLCVAVQIEPLRQLHLRTSRKIGAVTWLRPVFAREATA